MRQTYSQVACLLLVTTLAVHAHSARSAANAHARPSGRAGYGARVPASEVLGYWMTFEEKKLIALADAMPADKYQFVPIWPASETSLGNELHSGCGHPKGKTTGGCGR